MITASSKIALSPERLHLWREVSEEAIAGRISRATERMLKGHLESDIPLDQLTDMVENVFLGGNAPLEPQGATNCQSIVIDKDSELHAGPKVPRCEVFVVRHGERLDEVPGNDWRQRCPAQWFDPPLTDKGKRQAEYAASQLQLQDSSITFDVIYCSPLQRCVSTAAYFSQAFGAPIKLVPGLGECCAAMRGAKYQQMCHNLLPMHELTKLCPQATFCETDSDVMERFVGMAGQTCVGRLAKKKGRILVISHREAIRDLAQLAGISERLRTAYAAIAQFTCSNAATPEEQWEYRGYVHQGTVRSKSGSQSENKSESKPQHESGKAWAMLAKARAKLATARPLLNKSDSRTCEPSDANLVTDKTTRLGKKRSETLADRVQEPRIRSQSRKGAKICRENESPKGAKRQSHA